MADEKQAADVKLPDPVELSRAMAGIAERSQKLVSDFLERQSQETNGLNNQPLDPLNIGGAFFDMTARLMTDPTKLMQAQLGFWQDYMKLWQSTAQRMLG